MLSEDAIPKHIYDDLGSPIPEDYDYSIAARRAKRSLLRDGRNPEEVDV